MLYFAFWTSFSPFPAISSFLFVPYVIVWYVAAFVGMGFHFSCVKCPKFKIQRPNKRTVNSHSSDRKFHMAELPIVELPGKFRF